MASAHRLWRQEERREETGEKKETKGEKISCFHGVYKSKTPLQCKSSLFFGEESKIFEIIAHGDDFLWGRSLCRRVFCRGGQGLSGRSCDFFSAGL